MSSNEDDWAPGAHRPRWPGSSGSSEAGSSPGRAAGNDGPADRPQEQGRVPDLGRYGEADASHWYSGAVPGSSPDPFGPPDQTGPLAAPHLPAGGSLAGPPDLSGPLGPLEMTGPLAEYGLTDFAVPGSQPSPEERSPRRYDPPGRYDPPDRYDPPAQPPSSPSGRRDRRGRREDDDSGRYGPASSTPAGDGPVPRRSHPPWEGGPLDTRTPWEEPGTRGPAAGRDPRDPATGWPAFGPPQSDQPPVPGQRSGWDGYPPADGGGSPRGADGYGHDTSGPGPSGPHGDGPESYRPSLLNLGGYQPGGTGARGAGVNGAGPGARRNADVNGSGAGGSAVNGLGGAGVNDFGAPAVNGFGGAGVNGSVPGGHGPDPSGAGRGGYLAGGYGRDQRSPGSRRDGQESPGSRGDEQPSPAPREEYQSDGPPPASFRWLPPADGTGPESRPAAPGQPPRSTRPDGPRPGAGGRAGGHAASHRRAGRPGTSRGRPGGPGDTGPQPPPLTGRAADRGDEPGQGRAAGSWRPGIGRGDGPGQDRGGEAGPVAAPRRSAAAGSRPARPEDSGSVPGPRLAGSREATAARPGARRPPERGGPARPEPDRHGPQQAADRNGPRGGGFLPGFADRGGGGRRPRRRHGRWLAPVISLVVLLIIVGVTGSYLYSWYAAKHANYPGPGTGTVVVQVKSGDNAGTLAPQLLRKGVIKAADPFIAAARDSSDPSGLLPGYFRLHKHMNAALAWTLLLNPKSQIKTTVVIPDGLRLAAILTSLSQQTGIGLGKFQAAAKETATLGLPPYAHGGLEGYLYPATYTFPPGTSAHGILQTMVAKFSQVASVLNLVSRAKAVYLTPGQVITIASLLEVEGTPKYYSEVARVIDNRLNVHMYLELDSTVLYALHKTGFLLTQQQLKVNSPFNTFIHKGLPPGPIDNPTQTAIEAALHPAKGNWIYFVTTDPKRGITKFTNSYAQFKTFEARCRANKAC